MKYAFTDFVFDGEQLILYKNNEVVACRHNEAKLLALFLSEPQRVFSKDDILERVWSGKVVSEQAVFQNISVLRALFGEDAIKTFSKKGYQWQLEVNLYMEPAITPESKQRATGADFSFSKTRWILIGLALIVLSMGSFFYWRSIQADLLLPRVALLPLLVEPNNQHNPNVDADLVQPVWQAINHTKIFHPVVVNDLKDYDDFFHTPQKYFTQLAWQTHSGVVMVARVRAHKGKVCISYLLKSEKGMWGTGHEAETIPQLLKKLNAHIALILQSKILDVDFLDSALINAKLKILHQQAPDDFTVLTQLIRSEIQTGNTSNAILLADEMTKSAQLQGDKIREAWSYVVMADAYIAQGLYENAESRLQKAWAIFQEEQDYFSLATMQYSYASLAFAKHDYSLFKQSMVAAMQFAKEAQDPLSEVGFSNYLSVVANKFGEKLDRQKYLDQAEAILDQTHQSKEHYGSIYFYGGMYAETEALAEKNYRKVLAVLPADQQWWERERAQVHLAELLIKQARWEEARALFPKDKPLQASEELMVAKIYSAQQQWDEAEAHGLNSFKVANLSGQTSSALDAALVLLNIYQQAGKAEKAQVYEQFLVRDAKNVPYWIRFNKPALIKLGLQLDDSVKQN
jgi:DNA-binding winged helix-turn-helix (wHTH) protein/tetratricopeptide (TPR) repeat protein